MLTRPWAPPYWRAIPAIASSAPRWNLSPWVTPDVRQSGPQRTSLSETWAPLSTLSRWSFSCSKLLSKPFCQRRLCRTLRLIWLRHRMQYGMCASALTNCYPNMYRNSSLHPGFWRDMVKLGASVPSKSAQVRKFSLAGFSQVAFLHTNMQETQSCHSNNLAILPVINNSENKNSWWSL